MRHVVLTTSDLATGGAFHRRDDVLVKALIIVTVHRLFRTAMLANKKRSEFAKVMPEQDLFDAH